MDTRERAQTLPAPPATANPSPTAAAPPTAAPTTTSALRRSASDAGAVAPSSSSSSSPPTSSGPLPKSSSGIVPPLKGVRGSSDDSPPAAGGKRRTLGRILPTSKGNNTAAATTPDVDNNSDDSEHWSDERVEWAGITYSLDGLPPFDSDCPNALRAAAAMEPAPGSTDPTMRAYNPTHCLWLAMAAALAYRSSAQIKHVVTRIWRWDEAEFFEDEETDTQGFGMYNHQAIIVSFRGTVGKQNWLTNLDYCPTEPFPTLKGVKVHNGFNSALMSVFEDVRRFILKARANNPTLPLYLGGHSLGGALANMLLAYLSMPSCMATCPLYKPPTKKDRKKSKANLRASDIETVQKEEKAAAVKESTGGSAIVGGGGGERKAGRFRSLISRGGSGGKAKEAAPDSTSSDSDDDDVSSSTPRGSVGDEHGHPQLPPHSQSVPNLVLSDDDDDVSDGGGDDALSQSAPVKAVATSAHVIASRPNKHHPHSDPLLSAKENEKRAKRARKELKEKQREEKKKAAKAAKAASKAQQLPTSPRRSAGNEAEAKGASAKPSLATANAKQKQSFVEQRVLKRGHTACDLSLLMPARQTDATAAADADSSAVTDSTAAVDADATAVTDSAAATDATATATATVSATTDDSALPSAGSPAGEAEATAKAEEPSIEVPDVAATSSSTDSSSSPSSHADGWHSTSAPVTTTTTRPPLPQPPLSQPLPAAAAVVAAMNEAATCDITSLVAASSAVAGSHLQALPFVPIAVAGVYTFGQPKVGNDEFVYELKRHAPSTGFYRVTHNNDVVPSLPRKGYAHCGRRIFVSQDGLLIQGEGVAREVRELNRGGVGAIRRTKRGLMDHLMRAYLDQVVNHYRLNEPDLVSPCSPASPRGAHQLRGLLEVEQTVLRAEDAGFAPESVEDFMAALRGFSVADAIQTDNLGKTKKAAVKEAKKKATESIKLIKKKEKALRRRSQNLEDAIEPTTAVAVRPTHRRTKSTGTSWAGILGRDTTKPHATDVV